MIISQKFLIGNIQANIYQQQQQYKSDNLIIELTEKADNGNIEGLRIEITGQSVSIRPYIA